MIKKDQWHIAQRIKENRRPEGLHIISFSYIVSRKSNKKFVHKLELKKTYNKNKKHVSNNKALGLKCMFV